MPVHTRDVGISTSHYHTFHLVPVMAARELTYFEQEGLTDYFVNVGGLLPASVEKFAVRRAMKEKGIDIVNDAKPLAVFYQRNRGEDIFIVGGWRNQALRRLYVSKEIRSLAELKGKRVGIRDYNDIAHLILQPHILRAGIDPKKEVTWVRGLHVYQQSAKALLDGTVDAAFPQDMWNELEQRGFHALIDFHKLYPQGRPDRVIAATGEFIDSSPDKLEAYLRAITRSYWFCRNGANLEYLASLSRRLGMMSRDAEERRLVTVFSEAPKTKEDMEKQVFPIDGAASLQGLETMAKELLELGELEEPIEVAKVARLEYVRRAFGELERREELKSELQGALRLREKYGY